MGGAPGEPQHRLERVERARPDVAEDHSQCREAECGQATGVRRACYRIDCYLRQRANSGKSWRFFIPVVAEARRLSIGKQRAPVRFSRGRACGFPKSPKKCEVR